MKRGPASLLKVWDLLALAALHVAGVAFTSRRQNENRVRAMLDGKKAMPSPDDVD